MADLQTVVKRRSAVRSKLTKTISKAEALLEGVDRVELEAILKMLETHVATLTAMDAEVSSLVLETDVDDEIEAALNYEFKANATIVQLSQKISSLTMISKPKENGELIEFMKEQNNVSKMLAVSQEKIMLPRKEPESFDGTDLTKFKPFLNSFKRLIEIKTDSDADRLYYLEQFTTGMARELVRSCAHMEASRGFATAMRLLNERYGDEFGIANAFLERLDTWPPIKQEDGKALETLAVFLTGCANYVEDVSSLNQLHSPKQMQAIVMKLPYKLRERWRNLVGGLRSSNKDILFKDLVEFVNQQARLVNMPIFGDIKDSKSSVQKPMNKPVNTSFQRRTISMTTGVKQERNDKPRVGTLTNCSMCKSTNHFLNDCPAFNNKTYDEKRDYVKKNALCFGCLRYGHKSSDCTGKLNCKRCNRKHPTSLHLEKIKETPVESSSTNPIETTTLCTGAGGSRRVALALIPVRVRMRNQDKVVTTYAGLDNFSSDCFISDSLLQELGVSGTPTEICLTTMGRKRSPLSTRVVNNLEISDLEGSETISLPLAYSKDELPIGREDIPTRNEIEKWPHLKDVPYSFVDADVGLIIGVNIAEAIKPLEIVDGVTDGPYASRHKLGWAINGPLSKCETNRVHVHRVKVETIEDLDDKLQTMWNHDYKDSSATDRAPSIEDRLWEEKVASTAFRSGHYVVPLPFKDDNPNFPQNRGQALQQLLSSKKRFQNDSTFRSDYSEFMQSMIENGFMERVPENEMIVPKGKSWYITHHPVYHKQKGKIRVVFNCSLKYNGISLNDHLLQGPDLTNNLLGVLLRFRQGNVALVADIEKMFYQVRVPKDQTDFLRLFWFPEGNLDKEPIEYRLTVHVFGATSSPSCANFALRRTALDNRDKFSEKAVTTIFKNFYVDDMIKSVDTAEDAITLVRDIRELCNEGGFKLTKFFSNRSEVNESIPKEHLATGVQDFDMDRNTTSLERVLGVTWCIQHDSLGYKIELPVQQATRRGILSSLFSIYDPFGFIGPATLPGKRIFQELCKLKIAWDDPIPDELERTWKRWISELPLLADYEVPRCLRPREFLDAMCEAHIFCDGSELGYGAVAYLKFCSAYDRIHCSIVMAKCRLAPLKKMTIPRLELTAAKLAINLKITLEHELELSIDRYVFWTDSMVVLKYINNTTKRFQRFVANRVAFIRDHSKPEDWHHVPSKENPADCASRGLPISSFVTSSAWKNGPDFLWNEGQILEYDKVDDIEDDDPEVKKSPEVKVYVSRAEENGLDRLINSTSSWYRLKRRIAWLLKIKECLRAKTKLQLVLSLNDLDKAETSIIRHVQGIFFGRELTDIPNGRLWRQSALYKLNPTIDTDGLIRVGGRISRSSTSLDVKHPIILPKGCYVAKLIVQAYHRKLGCMGRETVLSTIRQKFWIIGANRLLRKVTHECLFCRKRQGRPSQQLMSDLPAERLVGDQPPFTHVGIDCFGPFHVSQGRSSVKRYGVVFTCLSSRAIHLEIAFSLDTDSFINALRRFIARRGQVKIIRSDNGSNFVGGENELRSEIQRWNHNKISEALLQREVQWTFNPPTASHFGGVWEREIRTVRKVLTGLLREQPIRFTDDLLNTLLCEVEAILNSRPLTSISDDPDDYEAITPNHILLMKTGPTFPPGLFSKDDAYATRRWRQVQYLADLFWTRWRKEYLTSLQKRQKWNQDLPPHAVGDLVLVVDQLAPRNQWALGRVIETLPDADDRVRVVKVRTVNVGDTKNRSKFVDLLRPISKLILLKRASEL